MKEKVNEMALAQLSFYSNVLGMDVPCNILLPENRRGSTELHPDRKYPVLYCLHGNGDSADAWIRKSAIELEARHLPLIVVMPTTHRGNYINEKHGQPYFTFFTEELPAVIQKYFPASGKREDTFVMGNSMGGYGALRLALARPDLYAGAASLSGAMDPYTKKMHSKLGLMDSPAFRKHKEDIFGTEEEFRGSENDLYHLADLTRNAEGLLPRLFHCCGTEDFLTYEQGKDYTDYLQQNCPWLDLQVEVGPGGHDWSFWNPMLPKILEYFGLTKRTAANADDRLKAF